jgi:hypothetical protein
MLHACASKFNVTENLKKVFDFRGKLIFQGSRQETMGGAGKKNTPWPSFVL